MGLAPDDRRPAHLLRRADRFCPLSLGDWLQTAERAGVTAVPAETAAVFERDDMLNHEYNGPHQARLDAAYAKLASGTRPGTMLRWDCCASADLKFALGDALEPDDETLTTLPLDVRILEAAYEWPRVVLPAWRRPWLRERMRFADGYPVEYRAFVEDGRLRGVSSYYIQRPLRRNDREIAAVEEATGRLMSALKPPFEWPVDRDHRLRLQLQLVKIKVKHNHESGPEARGPDPDRMHFTADFCVLDDGEVLLLEGGPPSFMGADPCCFRGGKIDGVALAPRHGDRDERQEKTDETATESASPSVTQCRKREGAAK